MTPISSYKIGDLVMIRVLDASKNYNTVWKAGIVRDKYLERLECYDDYRLQHSVVKVEYVKPELDLEFYYSVDRRYKYNLKFQDICYAGSIMPFREYKEFKNKNNERK